MLTMASPAPEFPPSGLLGTDGLRHHLTDFRYARVLVIVFMCNHCPYVKSVQKRINDLARQFREREVQVVAINSNDATGYPEDSYEAMQCQAHEQGFVFPYLWDETQEVARDYGAVSTPDFFAFEQIRPEEFREADLETAGQHYKNAFVLRYRGRLDDNWKDEFKVKDRSLAHAIEDILANRTVLVEQIPSLGCSIQWRAEENSRQIAGMN